MSAISGLASELGRLLVPWLVAMNQWTAGLLAAAFFLDQVLARRVRASWRVALYVPIVLRLLLPRAWTLALVHAPRVVTLLTPLPVNLPSAPRSLGTGAHLGWPALALAVYVLVAAALAYGVLRRRRVVAQRTAACRSASLGASAPSLRWPVVEHPELGPMVVGLVRPRIVLPTALLAGGDEGALASVLRHEATHIARLDPWLTVAMQAVLVLAWPVVPLWVACWRVRQLMELASDEGALVSADPAERRRYGHVLLDLAEWRSVGFAPIDAELHFGSTLRARISALAWTDRWPAAAQVSLVMGIAAAFLACSSVAASSPKATASPPLPEPTAAWSPPPAGTPLWAVGGDPHAAPSSVVDRYCAPLVEATYRANAKTSGPNLPGQTMKNWMAVATDGMPPEQVAFCRGSDVTKLVMVTFWANEARFALAQIGKDNRAAFLERRSQGNPTLCPSAPALPRVLQAPGDSHVQTPESEWNDGAGWQCLRFSFSVPTFFQYRMDNDPTHLTATARSQRVIEGQLVDVTMVLRGDVEKDELTISPYIAETWTTRH